MITMRFEGGDELAAALDALSTRITKRLLIEALTEAAEPLRSRARRIAPRAPGPPDLADHIETMTLRGGYEGSPAVVVGPTKEVFYGSFQEFGTSRHGAQPFMRPAFDTEAAGAIEVIKAALWRELSARGVSRTVSAPSLPSSGGPLL